MLTLWAHGRDILNLLAFGERFETFSQNVGVMDEKILPTISRGDKTIPLAVIEPFYGSFLFGHTVLLILCGSAWATEG